MTVETLSTAARKIAFKVSRRYMSLKVTQGHRKWCDSVGLVHHFLFVVSSNNIANVASF